VNTGTTDVDELALRLNSGMQAYVRALVRRTRDGWELYHVWALIGAKPLDWQEQTWRYANIMFIASPIPAQDLAVLCARTSEAAITLDGVQAAVPTPQARAQWTNHPSFARLASPPLPWPVTEYSVSAADQSNRQLEDQMLVGQSCPSFPELNSGWRAFSEGNFSLKGAQQPPDRLARLQFASQEAWIGPVHVTPTELTADIRGSAVSGCEVECSGVTSRITQTLDRPGVVRFALESGLPESVWLWLKRGAAWLDYRSIDPRSGWTGDLRRAGVQIDTPVEPQANVEALLAAGEGPLIEYKRQLPVDANQTRKMLKTVAAFSSGQGGTMVFGMDPDELTVTGLGQEDAKQLRDRLYALVNRVVIPSPDVVIHDYRVDGKTILVIAVLPGQVPPYGIAADRGSRDKPEYYIRCGSSTYPAQPGELREAARSRPSIEHQSNRRTHFGPR
jgi:hypothetical protein